MSCKTRFSSPFGVLHFLAIITDAMLICKRVFSSPLEIIHFFNEYNIFESFRDSKFSSPLGVIHFLTHKARSCMEREIVLVPFRGNTFLNFLATNGKMELEDSVLVPSRGDTFLNLR